MAARTNTLQHLDTLALARRARARRDAYVGQMIRGAFATLFARSKSRDIRDDWGTALSPLGSAAR